ncbi:MAG: (deoxy)nucleoside triphosphate pyrophosphohydrolase [Bacteroidetes bacterium]|nr:(deoxy)nucleoside triphosphate pyrophosphohydrolase [Bacteroidota bacterium]
MKHYEVVAAIIINDGKILCMQRNISKYEYVSLKYEFPGGKIEAGESKEQALSREILEEMDLKIDIGKEFLTVEHEYPDFKLTMHSFLCKSSTNEFNLKEHVDFKWLSKSELKNLDWAAADVPIVNKLILG